MFKDCQNGGYNLESTHATGQLLIALILLIAIVYTIAGSADRNSRKMGLQQYVGRLQELKRYARRHSAF